MKYTLSNILSKILVSLVFILALTNIGSAQQANPGADELWESANHAIASSEQLRNPQEKVELLKQALEDVETILQEYPTSDPAAMLIVGSSLPPQLERALRKAETELEKWRADLDLEVTGNIKEAKKILITIADQDSVSFWNSFSALFSPLVAKSESTGIDPTTLATISAFEDHCRAEVLKIVEDASTELDWPKVKNWGTVAMSLDRTARPWGKMGRIENYISQAEYQIFSADALEAAERADWRLVEKSASTALSIQSDNPTLLRLHDRAKFELSWQESIALTENGSFLKAWETADAAIAIRRKNSNFDFSEEAIEEQDLALKNLVYEAAIASSKSAINSAATRKEMDRSLKLHILAEAQDATGDNFVNAYDALVGHMSHISNYVGQYTTKRTYTVGSDHIGSKEPNSARIMGISGNRSIHIYYKFGRRSHKLVTVDTVTRKVTSRDIKGSFAGATRDGSTSFLIGRYFGEYPLILSGTLQNKEVVVDKTGLSVHDSAPVGSDSIAIVAESGSNSKIYGFRGFEAGVKKFYEKKGRGDVCCGIAISGDGTTMAIGNYEGGVSIFKLSKNYQLDDRVLYMSIPPDLYKGVGRIVSLSLSDDGSRLGIYSKKMLNVISTNQKRAQRIYNSAHNDEITVVDRDLQRILFKSMLDPNDGSMLGIYDIPSSRVLAKTNIIDSKKEILDMFLSDDAKSLILLYKDNSVDMVQNEVPGSKSPLSVARKPEQNTSLSTGSNGEGHSSSEENVEKSTTESGKSVNNDRGNEPKINYQNGTKCSAHMKANRLTTGKGGNAFDCFSEILRTDTENADAISGIREIEEKYVNWAATAINKKNFKKAIDYIAKLSYVNSDNALIAELNRKVADMSQELQGSPTLITTSRIRINGLTVELFGIEGFKGKSLASMKSFIKEQGDDITCVRNADTVYKCETSTKLDIASAALLNGAAKVNHQAPEAYKKYESDAKVNKRGIWGE